MSQSDNLLKSGVVPSKYCSKRLHLRDDRLDSGIIKRSSNNYYVMFCFAVAKLVNNWS